MESSNPPLTFKLPLVRELTERIIRLHDAQAALLPLMKHHGLLNDDPKGERPLTQRELDELS